MGDTKRLGHYLTLAWVKNIELDKVIIISNGDILERQCYSRPYGFGLRKAFQVHYPDPSNCSLKINPRPIEMMWQN